MEIVIYCNPFRNESVPNEDDRQIEAESRQKVLPFQTPK